MSKYVRTPVQITDAERRKRQEATDFARAPWALRGSSLRRKPSSRPPGLLLVNLQHGSMKFNRSSTIGSLPLQR